MTSLCPNLQKELSRQLSVAINEIESLYDTVEATTLAAILLKDAEKPVEERTILVVDVREEEEYNDPQNVFINGSVNIPHFKIINGDVTPIKSLLEERKAVSRIVFVSQASPDLDASSAVIWSEALDEMPDGPEKDRYALVKLSILLGGVGTWAELHGGNVALTGSTPKKSTS